MSGPGTVECSLRIRIADQTAGALRAPRRSGLAGRAGISTARQNENRLDFRGRRADFRRSENYGTARSVPAAAWLAARRPPRATWKRSLGATISHKPPRNGGLQAHPLAARLKSKRGKALGRSLPACRQAGATCCGGRQAWRSALANGRRLFHKVCCALFNVIPTQSLSQQKEGEISETVPLDLRSTRPSLDKRRWL